MSRYPELRLVKAQQEHQSKRQKWSGWKDIERNFLLENLDFTKHNTGEDWCSQSFLKDIKIFYSDFRSFKCHAEFWLHMDLVQYIKRQN